MTVGHLASEQVNYFRTIDVPWSRQQLRNSGVHGIVFPQSRMEGGTAGVDSVRHDPHVLVSPQASLGNDTWRDIMQLSLQPRAGPVSGRRTLQRL